MSNYKKLGDYISKIDKKNKDLSVTNLKGLSMTKEFRESTSNTVGTDMSKYRIVDQWHFACDFMSTIRVHAFPVVLNTEIEPVLVSPAYPVFKVNDHNKLDPEYLMMWFRRSEFDRYADFKCDGAIRGGFGWEDLCEVELPIPSIEKQREIVNEYNTVVNRIKLNEQLNQKLEETAQALYKHWFVDFEFPNEDGQPYKSSGGKMVYNEELDKEVSLGWKVSDYENTVSFTTGKLNSNSAVEDGKYPFFTRSAETFKD
ncbi:restriction endonuclease subunit S [Pasteurella atlantica]|uniref:Restriction endonuclease subunit S n=2 Tax=Pasteurellaceae TaxID=712 RepID=A0ACC6HPG7_9PAST|nr:restriction endonuclease subunit S [Pasteurella atlantica]MDP8052760.1 restriction endonuclease subunit S [Pasteurella atlantica]MDP8106057.1 restriction endonuclease subunit S [Pasteurella atlantica]MDP8149436.1 restriction endonuclease subunit S [Pasteurella atlantica]